MSKAPTFDMTFPTSPQRVAARSAAHVTKDYFSKPENRDEKANLPWQVCNGLGMCTKRSVLGQHEYCEIPSFRLVCTSSPSGVVRTKMLARLEIAEL